MRSLREFIDGIIANLDSKSKAAELVQYREGDYEFDFLLETGAIESFVLGFEWNCFIDNSDGIKWSQEWLKRHKKNHKVIVKEEFRYDCFWLGFSVMPSESE